MITEAITGVVAAANLWDGYKNRNEITNPNYLRGGDEYKILDGNLLDFTNIITASMWAVRAMTSVDYGPAIAFMKNLEEQMPTMLENNPELLVLICAGGMGVWFLALVGLAAAELIAYVMVEGPSRGSKLFRSVIRTGFRGIEKNLSDIKPVHG